MTVTAQPSASATSRNASIAPYEQRRCAPASSSGFFAPASRAVARSTAEASAWELLSSEARTVSNGAGSGAGRVGQVAGDLDVGRLALAERGADRVIDHGWCVVGVQDADGSAGHLPEHFVLVREVVGADGVVDDVIGAGVVGVVAGRDEDQGQPFCVSPGHAVKCGECPYVEGGDERAAAVDPGIGFGGIRCVELVTATDLLNVLVRQQLIEQDQAVVPPGQRSSA
jgi:hypothetical protein